MSERMHTGELATGKGMKGKSALVISKKLKRKEIIAVSGTELTHICSETNPLMLMHFGLLT